MNKSYLAIDIKHQDSSQYVLLEIPSENLPRFVKLPDNSESQRTTLILLDNIVRFCLDDLLKGFFEYDSLSSYAIKNDSRCGLRAQEGNDSDILEAMSLGLEQRLTALPIRLIYESEMPLEMLDFAQKAPALRL